MSILIYEILSRYDRNDSRSQTHRSEIGFPLYSGVLRFLAVSYCTYTKPHIRNATQLPSDIASLLAT